MHIEGNWVSAKPRKKTNAEKRSEKLMRNSYFTQQYDAYGENFTNFKSAQDVRRESYKIFKSLAENAIDLEKHGKCFLDPVFVGALRDVAYEKMTYHNATQIGLQIFIDMMTSQNRFVEGFIYENYSAHVRSMECYTLIYNAMFNIQLTYDYENILSILMPQLSAYRNSL
jgi:hypothetical protein